MIAANPEMLVAEARQLLSNSRRGAASKLAVSNEYVSEGEWVHLIVYPTAEGVSALDYLEEIEGIEKILRKKFGEEILVVPAKP